MELMFGRWREGRLVRGVADGSGGEVAKRESGVWTRSVFGACVWCSLMPVF